MREIGGTSINSNSNSNNNNSNGSGDNGTNGRYVYTMGSHTASLINGLNGLRSKGLLLDISLVADGQTFQAHKVVLASCSDYFRAMFTDEMKESRQTEISLNGITARGLCHLLEYMYTSRLALSLSNIQDVLSTANHIQLVPVVEACSQYLEEQLDLDNCVDIATISETYSLWQLRKKVYRFICANLSQFTHTQEFHRLSFAQLEHILESDFPVDCAESDILEILLKWIQLNAKDRAQFLPSLLRHIRFKEIPKEKLDHQWTNVCNQFLLDSLNYSGVAIAYKKLLSQISSHDKTGQQQKCNGSTNSALINSRGMELAIVKAGGFNNVSGISNEICYYLPSSGKWRYLTRIPHVEQSCFGTAVHKNCLYIIGGCFNQSLQENVHPFGFRYNPTTNSWSTITPMQKERCRFALCVVDGYLYAIGGAGENFDSNNDNDRLCEKYDPVADIWTTIASFPGCNRAQHAGASWSNYIYISGGLDQDTVLDSLMRYNTISDEWEIKSSLLVPRADHSMVCYGDKLFVIGGWREDDATGMRTLVDTVDCYDIREDSWSVVTTIPTPRYHAGIVITGSWLMIIGGFHSDNTFDRASGAIECFNLENKTWCIAEEYPQDIWEHACCTLFVPTCRDDLEVISDKG